MKTSFTLLLISFAVLISYAQNTTTSIQKTGEQFSGTTAIAQSFSIEKVYPNPVKDFVNIELKTEVTGSIQVSLINILGTEVKKWETFYLYQGNQKLRLDLSMFKSGVYILKITNQDQVRTQLLKKN